MAKNALILKGADFSANKVGTITIATVDIPCTGITLDQSAVTVSALGDTTLTASVTPADTTDDVVWTTSDATVATVANGVVSVVGLGTATITATCGEYSDTCTFTLAELTLSPYYCFARRQALTNYPNIFAITTSNRELTIADVSGLSTTRTLKNQSSSASLDCCPIILPANTATVELSYGSNMRSGTIYFGWLNTESAGYPETYPNIAELIELNTDNSTAASAATTWTYTKPTGANSIAISLTTNSTNFAESDTPEAIALAREIVVKCKPAA